MNSSRPHSQTSSRMSVPLFQTTTSTMTTYARDLLLQKRPDMEIFIDDHNDSKVYTTFDSINGRAEITAPNNVRFDEIKITLEGSTRTYVDNMSATTTKSRTSAYHNFLKLVMPIRESNYPQPRIAEAGRIYTFPFNFVIPNQLLPTSCCHKCEKEHVYHSHLQLPPSMGDGEVSGKDDLAPAMSKIQYAIKVQVIRHKETDGTRMILTEGLSKLHIVPTVFEAPPMGVSEDDKDYTFSKTKLLKKGVFSGKLGKITVSAPQPSAFVLPSLSSLDNAPASTIATINLRFDPHDATSKPPRLGGLTSKLKALTFFAVRPQQTHPSRATMLADYEPTRGIFSATVSLSSRCVENVQWVKHAPKSVLTRRCSDSSSSSGCSDNSVIPQQVETKVFYTAAVVVPISLPSSKAWIPTFHSCISSRIYDLDLSLSIHTPGAGVPATNIALRLPVQIAALGSRDGPVPLSPSETAAELAQADEFLTPRVIEIPPPELIGNSVLGRAGSDLPPSYDDFAELVPQQTVFLRAC